MCDVKSCYCIKHDLFSRGPDLLQVEVHFGHRFSLALMRNFLGQHSKFKLG